MAFAILGHSLRKNAVLDGNWWKEADDVNALFRALIPRTAEKFIFHVSLYKCY